MCPPRSILSGLALPTWQDVPHTGNEDMYQFLGNSGGLGQEDCRGPGGPVLRLGHSGWWREAGHHPPDPQAREHGLCATMGTAQAARSGGTHSFKPW